MTLNDTPAFVPFFGRVEALDDPKQLGRVRVRVFNHHDDLETEDLEWMSVGTPTTSASIAGSGTSPTWLEIGSIVFGFYFDGVQRNTPIVLGTLPTIPGGEEANHVVAPSARGKGDDKLKSPAGGPDIVGSPTYPNNKVIKTPSGHTIELDDSPGSSRIVVWHSSGSVVAINNNGDVVIHSVNDSYELVAGNKTEKVEKALSTEAKSIKIKSKGEITIESAGKTTINSQGAVSIKAPSVTID